jgi:hypothetical protein
VILFFYFENLLAPSELPANLPGQFSLSGHLFLHWALATLKGLVKFQNEKKTRPLFTITFNSKMLVSRSEILVYILILGVLGFVTYNETTPP